MTTAVATRICSTPGCERGALPHWAMCSDCIDDIFDPTPARQVFVRRLSDDPAQLVAPAPRADVRSDLAVPVAMGVSRGASEDEGARLLEAPDDLNVGPSPIAAARAGIEPAAIGATPTASVAADAHRQPDPDLRVGRERLSRSHRAQLRAQDPASLEGPGEEPAPLAAASG